MNYPPTAEPMGWASEVIDSPNEVHDAFWKEHHAAYEEIYKDIPHRGHGIFWEIEHPAEAREMYAAEKKLNVRERFAQESKNLRIKHYSRYLTKADLA